MNAIEVTLISFLIFTLLSAYNRVYITKDAFAKLNGRDPTGVDPTINISPRGSDLVFLAR